VSATVVQFTPAWHPATVRATVACGHCPWTAVHVGDNVHEVGTFLRALLLRHVAERHPELGGEERPS
jgi:hypothetical protein